MPHRGSAAPLTQTSFHGRRWLAPPSHIPASEKRVFDDLGVHGLVAHLLYNRGIRDRDAIERFLAGADASLTDPLRLKGMRDAVARIAQALDRDEQITIFGDYDVDGLTSTALLAETLGALGANVRVRIPHRERDGYGLSGEALAEEADRGATLVVAVDCGISAHDPIASAQARGLDVVVVDHHHVPTELPRARAIVNPHQPGCDFPSKELAAVGLAFCLARSILAARCGHAEADRRGSELLGLVALGTVADVAPLVGENRTLVAKGLRELNRRPSVGIAKLCAVAGVRPGSIDARTIGHVLGPRLNAAGRLDDALEAYELLTARDAAVAERLAVSLDAKKRERQRLTEVALIQALELLGGERPDLVFVASPNYHPGIVGLIAGKLVEQTYRPAVAVALGNDEVRGSARSIEAFHIAEALSQCDDLLTRHGGHALAAGFSLPVERLDALRARLEGLAEKAIRAAERASGEPLLPRQRVDGIVSPRRIDADSYRQLARLEPHGEGNPKPAFLGRSLRVVEARTVGREGAHLKLALGDGRTRWPAIAFGLGPRIHKLPDRVDVVYHVVENEWNGTCTLELVVEDMRPSASDSRAVS